MSRIILAVFSAVWVLQISSCALFGCENISVSESLRPGGPYRAVTFIRSCGATTPLSTHVSILGIKQLSASDSGNVFIGEGGDEARPGVTVRWLGRDLLEVTDLGLTDVFKAEKAWNSIRVRYNSTSQ